MPCQKLSAPTWSRGRCALSLPCCSAQKNLETLGTSCMKNRGSISSQWGLPFPLPAVPCLRLQTVPTCCSPGQSEQHSSSKDTIAGGQLGSAGPPCVSTCVLCWPAGALSLFRNLPVSPPRVPLLWREPDSQSAGHSRTVCPQSPLCPSPLQSLLLGAELASPLCS